jgi:outer membrane receptor protein involved in Fe transport
LGFFVMLESPALWRAKMSSLTFSLMYSWASPGSFSMADEVAGVAVSQGFGMDLHSLALGPRWVTESDRLRLSLSSGLSLNLARWDAFSTQQNLFPLPGGPLLRQDTSGMELRPGIYVDMIMQLRLTQRWSLLAGARYDWAGHIEETHNWPFVPGQYAVFRNELGGWSAFAGLTYRF